AQLLALGFLVEVLAHGRGMGVDGEKRAVSGPAVCGHEAPDAPEKSTIFDRLRSV
ncbi:MAG: hypothetical protein ACI9YT_002131, partial [Halobacteriales archaeon]